MPRKVMVDLETLSIRSNAMIVSIGACTFGSPKQVKFESLVNIEKGNTGHIEPATLLWWMGQSTEAQKATFLDGPRWPLKTALQDFSHFLATQLDPDYEIWSNGSDYDVAILRNAYLATCEPIPWNFRQVRCFRTLRSLVPEEMRMPQRTTERHTALADAVYQAEVAEKVFKWINR